MKRCLLTIVWLLSVVALVAKPAQPGLTKTIRLADGSQVRVELRGDEFAHFWADSRGKAYVKQSEGELYEEVSLESLTTQALSRRATQDEIIAQRRASRKNVTMGGSHMPYTGEKNMLLILVNFTDYKFQDAHDKEFYQHLCNEENFTDGEGNVHSVRDYFLAQSDNALDITFDVAGPIQLEHDHAYYGGRYATYGYQLVQSAVEGAHNEGIDFSKYDWDGDGEVDQVYIIFAGHDQSSYDDETLLWGMTDKLGTLRKVSYDGVTINTYAWSGELAGSGAVDGIGSMCHEFSHCLGLPDVYDVYYGESYGMWYWDVMDRGCYNGDLSGYIPAGYTSYERMYCGWFTPTELTDDTVVSDMKGLTEGGEAYVIYNKGDNNEYYLLENRSNYDFDSALPAHGLLMLHIDFNSRYWSSNLVNTMYNGNDHERYTVIACDDSYVRDDMATDIWPSVTNHLDNTTSPAATVYNANADGSYYMNITLSDITLHDDGTISFAFHPYGSTGLSFDPVDGATVDTLQVVRILSTDNSLTVADSSEPSVTVEDSEGTVVSRGTLLELPSDDDLCREIAITLSPIVLDKGEYTLTIPADAFLIGTMPSEEVVLHYVVSPPLALVFNPENGAILDELSSFQITCNEGLAQNKWDDFEVYTADGDYVTSAYISKSITQETGSITQWIGFELVLGHSVSDAGEYHITIPADYFILGDNADPLTNPEVLLVYYVETPDDEEPNPEDPDGIVSVPVDARADGVYYNTMGERVSSPTHGVYILNGRKVILR